MRIRTSRIYEHLPRAVTVADLEALLPWNVKPLLKATPAAQTPRNRPLPTSPVGQ
jgi:hypothetical protein